MVRGRGGEEEGEGEGDGREEEGGVSVRGRERRGGTGLVQTGSLISLTTK